MTTITTKDGTRSSTRTGVPRTPADRLPSWLAAECRRLGHADALLRGARAIASSPMTGAAMADRARSAMVTTWTTTPPTPPRWSSISTCGTPSISATRPAAARRRATSPGTASAGPRRQAGADRRRAADHGEDGGQSRRPADRGIRRPAPAARRQPRAVLSRSRERSLLRLQPAGREGRPRASSRTGGVRA